jgi:hypothetical protein
VPGRYSNDLHHSSSESSRCIDEQLPSTSAASKDAPCGRSVAGKKYRAPLLGILSLFEIKSSFVRLQMFDFVDHLYPTVAYAWRKASKCSSRCSHVVLLKSATSRQIAARSQPVHRAHRSAGCRSLAGSRGQHRAGVSSACKTMGHDHFASRFAPAKASMQLCRANPSVSVEVSQCHAREYA